MLWSLLKVLIFVAIVGALGFGVVLLLDTPGGVQITVADTEFTLGALQSVLAIAVLLVALWLILKLASLSVATLRFINGDETALTRLFDKGRERKGYKALTEGMMALSAGEGRLAMAKATRAEKYLENPQLTDLIVAQAAEMSGDTRKASEAYKRLLSNQSTRFVGVRGIMKQKLSEGDKETALALAEKALALRPKHEEVQDTLLQLQAQAQDWAGARKTLSTKLKTGTLPRDVFKRRDAVLALSSAKALLDEGATVEQQEKAIEANTLSPDLIPAAVLAAGAYVEKGKKRVAIRLLKKAWEAQPHPDLAHAFAAIEPDETPAARIKRFEPFLRMKPGHDENRLVSAELYVVAEEFPAARRALGDLPERAPDARALTLMAAIERGEGSDDSVVRAWLTRALSAPRGPQWVCDVCNHIHPEWAPICENCGSFDTLTWKSPEVAEVSSVTGAHMLPLIVGALEDKTEEAPADEPAEEAVSDAEVVEVVAEATPDDISEPEKKAS
ncbi:tetratricopeptide repeat protein [Epibacterium sp. SM1969]|uniref:Tetratricopeptide repeat protein n=1 Tax=Tritonibacter aquimaris TaxID=2663379 RepID=A0A844AKQ1_9RHOB|nr:heme biosynthesis HemY N-terminal domain-containing protein [Tritonibacter aquimaris]MQY41819.1 tetratricopeptide repeat protein [Tritonibacter aquimaris]